MLPGFALLAGYALTRVRGSARFWEMLPPALGFLALPAFLLWLRSRPASMRLPEWAADLPLWPIALLFLVGPALLWFARRETTTQLRALSAATLAATAVLYVGLAPAFAPFGDPGPTAQRLAALQAGKVPLAHLGKYHAQYNFIGRLRAPIAILNEAELPLWVAKHPSGQVVVVERTRHAGNGGSATGPEFQAPYRGAWIQVWRGEALLARPPAR
jgi:hypothetical protein